MEVVADMHAAQHSVVAAVLEGEVLSGAEIVDAQIAAVEAAPHVAADIKAAPREVYTGGRSINAIGPTGPQRLGDGSNPDRKGDGAKVRCRASHDFTTPKPFRNFSISKLLHFETET